LLRITILKSKKDEKEKTSARKCVLECVNEKTNVPLSFTMAGNDNAAILIDKYEFLQLLEHLADKDVKKELNGWLVRTTGFEYNIKLTQGGEAVGE
jgi:hypothetical protein